MGRFEAPGKNEMHLSFFLCRSSHFFVEIIVVKKTALKAAADIYCRTAIHIFSTDVAVGSVIALPLP